MINNFFIVGPMGCGKTTIGKILAKKIKKKFIDSDNEIELYFKISISLIFKIYGELFFRKLEIKFINKLSLFKNIVLSTGGGSILFLQNRFFLKKRGLIIYLKLNFKNLLDRKNLFKNRPLLQNFNLFEFLFKNFLKRKYFYKEISDFTIKIKKKNKFYIIKNIICIIKLFLK